MTSVMYAKAPRASMELTLNAARRDGMMARSRYSDALH